MIGIDVGFGFTKIYKGNIVFPSVFCEYRERIASIGPSNFMGNLTIEWNDKKYLIGDIAKNESGSATFDKDNQLRHILCMLTGIALANKSDYSGPVVMGLPISDLQKKNDLLLLKGKYAIKLCDKPINIEISDVMVIPQGAASYFDIILNDNGKVASANAEKHLGIIDIGEKTLCFVSMNKAQFQMERSGSLDLGVNKAYRRLCTTIQRKLNFSCMPYEVTEHFDKIPKEFEKEYRQLANEIVDAISQWWSYSEFDNIYLTGGGAPALKKYVSERINCDLVPDSQFSNARGYFKCGMAATTSTVEDERISTYGTSKQTGPATTTPVEDKQNKQTGPAITTTMKVEQSK
jgi:hypothetical protein